MIISHRVGPSHPYLQNTISKCAKQTITDLLSFFTHSPVGIILKPHPLPPLWEDLSKSNITAFLAHLHCASRGQTANHNCFYGATSEAKEQPIRRLVWEHVGCGGWESELLNLLLVCCGAAAGRRTESSSLRQEESGKLIIFNGMTASFCLVAESVWLVCLWSYWDQSLPFVLWYISFFMFYGWEVSKRGGRVRKS